MSYRNQVVGGGVPKVDHATKDEALTEASRLAAKEGKEVLTLRVIARTRAEIITFQHDMEEREINVEHGFDGATFEDTDDVSLIVVNHSKDQPASEAFFGIPPVEIPVEPSSRHHDPFGNYSEKWSF